MWKTSENLGNTEIKITVKETGVDSAQPDAAIRNVALTKASVKKGKIVVSLKGKKIGNKKVTLQVGDKKVNVMVKVQ